MFPTEWKVFGSMPWRHLTLDKAAGTAPRAVKVIYCWLCKPVRNPQRSTYRARCRHKCTVAHHVSRGLYIRIRCHSGVLLSVVALFSVLHKCSCNRSTGNRGVELLVAVAGAPACQQLLSVCGAVVVVVPTLPQGSGFSAADPCCLSSRLSISLPLSHLSSSSSERPVPHRDSVK